MAYESLSLMVHLMGSDNNMNVANPIPWDAVKGIVAGYQKGWDLDRLEELASHLINTEKSLLVTGEREEQVEILANLAKRLGGTPDAEQRCADLDEFMDVCFDGEDIAPLIYPFPRR